MNPFISHSQLTGLYVSAAVSMVIFSNSIRRRHHLTRSGILSPDQSPWRNLYENGDNQSFLNLTGFSREAFEEMHTYLYGNELDHLGPDRPRLLNSRDEKNVLMVLAGLASISPRAIRILLCDSGPQNHVTRLILVNKLVQGLLVVGLRSS
jgi:hypothetical protein